MRSQGFSAGELGMKLHPIAKAALTLGLLAAPCLAQAPRAAQDHFNRGGSLYQKGDFEGAIADFTKTIEISSRLDNRNWQGGAGFGGAATNFDKVTVLDPLAAAAYANRGLARYKLGDYEGAIADCDRALAINPRLYDAYINRGFARQAKGDGDGALKDFDKAVALDPRYASGYYGRAVALSDKDELERAVREFNRAIELDPRYALAYGNRGLALMRLGKDAEAVRDFERAVALKPELKEELELNIERARKWRQANR